MILGITARTGGFVFVSFYSAKGRCVMAHKHGSGQYDGRQLWTCSACGKEVQKNDIICPHCRESLSLVAASSRKSSGAAQARKGFWKQIFF